MGCGLWTSCGLSSPLFPSLSQEHPTPHFIGPLGRASVSSSLK